MDVRHFFESEYDHFSVKRNRKVSDFLLLELGYWENKNSLTAFSPTSTLVTFSFERCLKQAK